MPRLWLPEGTYKFRGDYQDSQYWATETLTAHQVNVVNLSTGGGSFTLSVEKESGSPLADIPVYVFTSSGSYLGINAQTDAQGQVSFDLADGDYKFRADYFGYQFWSNDYTVPGTLSDVLTITHQDVTVTVNQVYGIDIDPLQGVNVYLFTGAGAYQGIYQSTDANGQVTFNLPEKDYKVRADYLSAQYWSDVFSWQDVGVDINHGTAILHVTHTGQDLFDVPVYLFTETGSYLSRLERTDSSGQAQFLLPADSYKFRVDYDGTQYWSDVITLISHEENNIDLQLELLADLTHDPNPDRFDGIPPVFEPEKIMVASLSSIRGLLVQSVVGQTGEEQKIYYFINDHLGTPQKLLDENADVVWSVDYKPFGEANVDVNTFANRFRFPGQYFDTETGLHYNWHRYYDPKTGRYLTPDPIGLAGGINLFVYSFNNPINWLDPFGLKTYITIRRKSSTKISISGTINVRNDKGDVYKAYTIEPIKGGVDNSKDPVKAGKYDAFLRKDHNPNRIELRNVPDYENIQIHIGNDPLIDSDGCFLVGEKPTTDWLSKSADAINKILEVINSDATDEIEVNIVDDYEDPCK